MKKLIVLGFLALCLSCSTDDAPTFFFEVVPIDAVTNVPQVFQVNQADTLKISYRRPSSCHGFEGFEVDKDDNTRNISLITRVVEDRAPCSDLENDVKVAPLVFKPESSGSVVLQFFQGDDADGLPIFLTLEVPILE